MQSLLGGADCATSSNPLKQVAQREGVDNSLFRVSSMTLDGSYGISWPCDGGDLVLTHCRTDSPLPLDPSLDTHSDLTKLLDPLLLTFNRPLIRSTCPIFPLLSLHLPTLSLDHRSDLHITRQFLANSNHRGQQLRPESPHLHLLHESLLLLVQLLQLNMD